MQKIVGVRRADDKNIYYFSYEKDLNMGDKVVVNFDEFQTVATVVRNDTKIDKIKAEEIGKILRIATEADLKKYTELKNKATSNLVNIKRKSLELGLMMKFVGAEYSLDNSKIIITFSSEERVDFRQFLKDLAPMLKTRIELKQIGQRDEIKICGGVGPCGEPCCCARFLDNFEHVTVKMAKVQGLSLSPTKINGICGRLMCCLGYESEVYDEILSRMPKINSEVKTENGKGIVVYNDLLRERVSVKRKAELDDSFVVEDFALEDVEFEGHPAKHKEKKKEPENNTKESGVTLNEKEINSNNNKNSKQNDKNLKSNEHKKEQKFFEKSNKEKDKNQHNNNLNKTAEPEVLNLGENTVDKQNKHKNGFRNKFKNKNKPNSYNNKI